MKYQHILIAFFAVLMGSSYYLGYTPFAVCLIFFFTSFLTYSLYAKDKAAAKAGSWRVSENTLHIAALCCGWPGALIAQERLRHKTRKMSFRMVFWVTVLANSAGLVWLHGPQGNMRLRNGIYQLENLAISNVRPEAAVTAVLFLTKFRSKEALHLR